MVNTEIRLIIIFAAKDGEALYSQQKQDVEQTVAQIMNSLLPNIALMRISMNLQYYVKRVVYFKRLSFSSGLFTHTHLKRN